MSSSRGIKINNMENKKTGTKTSSNEPRYGGEHVFIWGEGYCKRALYADILYVQG